jgi:hypothetical protein
MIASTPSIELLDCNSTTNTPLLELFDYNVILSLPWLGLPDYNITFANGSKKCEHCHGTQKCRESKYLEISSSIGLDNFICKRFGDSCAWEGECKSMTKR